MPQSLNNAYLLDSSNGGAGDKKSRPFWWPGGYGELHVKGTVGGTAILHEGAPQLTTAERALAANYKPHGSTVAVDNGSDLFRAAEGWMYVELENTAGADNCEVWVSRFASGENTEPYFDDGNVNSVV